jgi:hypothetical protein
MTGFAPYNAATTLEAHMTGPIPSLSRRDALAAALVAAAALVSGAAAQAGGAQVTEDLARHAHDWDWLVGNWNVRHRRLNGRLVGSTDWQEFNGTSKLWLTMGGFGTVDDNVIEVPTGTYRAMGVRGFDRETRQWAIWWFDERYPATLGEPVRGGFRDGVGIFNGDDELNGRPIKVRFMWSEIAANSARWEQAFSADDGATWEVNWVMQFTRAA